MSAKKLLFAALLSAASFGAGIGLTIASGWLITMASQQPPILTLTVAIVGVRFFGISRSGFRYAERIMSHSAVFNALSQVRAKLFASLASQHISSVRDFVEGSFTKKIVDDVERAQEFQLRNELPRLSAYFSVTLGTLLALWITPRTLSFTIPAFLFLLYIIPQLSRSVLVKRTTALEEDESAFADAMTLSTLEIKEAQLFGYLENYSERQRSHVRLIAHQEKKLFSLVAHFHWATLFVLGVTLIAAMQSARTLTNPPAVRITMMIFIPLVIYESASAWFPALFISGKLEQAQKSVNEILDLPRGSKKAIAQPSGLEVRGENVSVSWGQGFMPPLSFFASPEKPLVIQGPNGSGKSTLALGISGVLDYEGSILICGALISSIENPEDFISSSLQNTHVFNTSIRENLKISRIDATDEQITHVLEIVELGYLDLDEIVGEFGRNLSGGESKRLSVARALLSKAPVVLLDEPLEHLDVDRASRIEQAILTHLRSRTLIVIAHSGWGALENRLFLSRG